MLKNPVESRAYLRIFCLPKISDKKPHRMADRTIPIYTTPFKAPLSLNVRLRSQWARGNIREMAVVSAIELMEARVPHRIENILN